MSWFNWYLVLYELSAEVVGHGLWFTCWSFTVWSDDILREQSILDHQLEKYQTSLLAICSFKLISFKQLVTIKWRLKGGPSCRLYCYSSESSRELKLSFFLLFLWTYLFLMSKRDLNGMNKLCFDSQVSFTVFRPTAHRSCCCPQKIKFSLYGVSPLPTAKDWGVNPEKQPHGPYPKYL